MVYYNETLPSYRRRRRPSPVINPRVVIAILLFLLFLLCLIGRGTFSRFGCSTQTTALKNYINETNKLAGRSNKISRDFNNLRANIKNLSRKDLNQRLNSFITESKKVAADAEKVEVPEEMEKIHFYLLFSFDLRVKAFEKLKPAIFNALTDQDLEVAGRQVSLALKDLALSDRAFSLFHLEAQKVLEKKKISNISAPTSVFLSNEAEYEMENVLEFLKQLQETSTLAEVHGVAVAKVSLKPEAKSEEAGIDILPSTKSIAVIVTVENQGNQLEINIPVKVTLKSETEPEPQEKQKTIGSLAPGRKKTVTIKGLKPTLGDIINLLTVEVGPVPSEKFMGNNTLEYKFKVERG